MDTQQQQEIEASPPRKRQKRDKKAAVQRPQPTEATMGVTTSRNRNRSLNGWLTKTINLRKKQLQYFQNNATTVRLPMSFADLEKPQDIAELERICQEELGPNKPAQCVSSIFVDKNEKTVLAYFGQRIKSASKQTLKKSINLADQYKGRTWADLKSYPPASITSDGLTTKQCQAYQLAAQSLCSDLPLHDRFDSTRHEGINIMDFSSKNVAKAGTTEAEKGDEDELDPEAYDLKDVSNSGLTIEKEQAGVLHLVHGWPQQGQAKNKGLFISGDISYTSTSLAAAGSHYYLTQPVAATLAEMFKVTFAEYYEKYAKAFKAGVWMRCDPGPYLGRAIIYKLQGKLHKDRHDVGPSASFGVGLYTGGEMLFPQLGAKFSYDPGHVCIFFSSVIYHKVAKFTPLIQSKEDKLQNITPGRIGNVFFFPKDSYQILSDKRPDWAYQTAFGKNDALMAKVNDVIGEDPPESEEETYRDEAHPPPRFGGGEVR